MSLRLTADGKKLWNKVIAKAWADAAYKKRLLADPAGVLREEGMQVAQKPRVCVVENSDEAVYLVLPANQQEELSEADLEAVAAGRAGIVIACMDERTKK